MINSREIMEMRKTYLVFLIFWTGLLQGVLAGQNCTTGLGQIEYCEHGCCYYDDDSDSSDAFDNYYADCCLSPELAGIIAGAVVGGIALITIIVVVIIVCAVKKHGKIGCGGGITKKLFSNRSAGRQGITRTQTHQPPPTGSTGNQYGQPYTTNFSGQGYGQPYPMGNVPPQYPPGPPPNAGIYNDPAYPPSGAPPPYAPNYADTKSSLT